MKKGIALFTAVSMLLLASLAVFAEETEDRTVLQNEQTPAIVVAGEAAAAICDADGSVLDGSLALVNVHDRSTDDAKWLINAFRWLMDDTQYSDGNTAMSENGKTSELAADAQVVCELFDIVLSSETAKLLVDGACIEVTVTLNLEQIQSAMILFTADGMNWRLLNGWTAHADNSMTLRLEQPGTIAFLAECKTASGQSDEPGDAQKVAGNSDAQRFMPSVSGKPAPGIVFNMDAKGHLWVATIHNRKEASVTLVSYGSLSIIPVSDRDDVVDTQTRDTLARAYHAILAAGTFDELQAGMGAEIDAILKRSGFNLTNADLVVRDLFALTVDAEYMDCFDTDGAYLEITFEEALTANDPLVVLYSGDAVNWHTVPAVDVQINGNGTLTLRLESLGAVAFLVERPEVLPDAEGAVTSPE